MIAYKAVWVEDGRMWSLYAGRWHVPGKKVEYRLGRTVRFPQHKPGMAVRTLAKAVEVASRLTRAGHETLLLKCEVQLAAPDERVPFQPTQNELIWCSVITPICIVNADGTEEPQEHRVVVTVEPSDARHYLRLRFCTGGCGYIIIPEGFGGIKDGDEVEVTTRVLKPPEPEPEPVKPTLRTYAVDVTCPACKTTSICYPPNCLPDKCYKCGVRFVPIGSARRPGRSWRLAKRCISGRALPWPMTNGSSS